jgi:hypothetical protein
MVLKATFNNISVISWQSVLLWRKHEYPEKTRIPAEILSQVADKLYHIMLYQVTDKLYHIMRGEMVSMLVSNAVDRGFEPIIKLVFVASLLSMQQ